MNNLSDKTASEMSLESLESLGAPDMVYVREITVEDLRDELVHEDIADEFDTNEAALHIEPGTKLYSLHAANGVRMAVVDSREAALMAARQYEMTPVSLH
jgi:hypothetical protein